MSKEKECIRCGNDFDTWEDDDMCSKCKEEEKNEN